jgi:AraC-like DNA-binding protein
MRPGAPSGVGAGDVRPDTVAARHRLYLLARVLVARHYRRRLTLPAVAGALASSPRQLQRAYEQFGTRSFREDLLARRMNAAATLLIEQPAIAVADVARLVGYRQPSHFARAFRRRYGLGPAAFREVARKNGVHRRVARPVPRSSLRG